MTRGETAVADIAAAATFIRERRGLPRLTTLGYSWGTALMGRYAADNPALVERLVLYAPVWLRQTASLADPGGELGAYRLVTVEAARRRRGAGVPEAKRDTMVPAGWFEQWAGATWATDPEAAAPQPAGAARAQRLRRGRPGILGRRQALLRPREDHRADLAGARRMGPGHAALHGQRAVPAAHRRGDKRLVILGEGTHGMWMERNRGALFQAVQVFLEEVTA